MRQVVAYLRAEDTGEACVVVWRLHESAGAHIALEKTKFHPRLATFSLSRTRQTACTVNTNMGWRSSRCSSIIQLLSRWDRQTYDWLFKQADATEAHIAHSAELFEVMRHISDEE